THCPSGNDWPAWAHHCECCRQHYGWSIRNYRIGGGSLGKQPFCHFYGFWHWHYFGYHTPGCQGRWHEKQALAGRIVAPWFLGKSGGKYRIICTYHPSHPSLVSP